MKKLKNNSLKLKFCKNYRFFIWFNSKKYNTALGLIIRTQFFILNCG